MIRNLNEERLLLKLTKLENSLSEEILEIQENLDTSTSKYHTDLKSNVDLFEEIISKQFKEMKLILL